MLARFSVYRSPSFSQGGRSAEVHREDRPHRGDEGPKEREGQTQEAQGAGSSPRHAGSGVGAAQTLTSRSTGLSVGHSPLLVVVGFIVIMGK